MRTRSGCGAPSPSAARRSAARTRGSVVRGNPGAAFETQALVARLGRPGGCLRAGWSHGLALGPTHAVSARIRLAGTEPVESGRIFYTSPMGAALAGGSCD